MNDNVRLLIVKARENLSASKLLFHQGYYDIAVSRAYYSMFYLSEALLQSKGMHFSSHSAVIAAFGKEFAKPGVLDNKFHHYLIKSQSMRQVSDYGYTGSVSSNIAMEVLQWADEFLIAVEQYLESNNSQS